MITSDLTAPTPIVKDIEYVYSDINIEEFGEYHLDNYSILYFPDEYTMSTQVYYDYEGPKEYTTYQGVTFQGYCIAGLQYYDMEGNEMQMQAPSDK